MQKRKLGTTACEVAPLAFGGNVFGWTVDEPTSFRLLDAFVDASCSLIDTADSYSHRVPGHNRPGPCGKAVAPPSETFVLTPRRRAS